MSEFKKYSEEKPQEKGLYVWRVQHDQYEDIVVTFVAKFHERGAGFETVLSPEFDHWDGYRVHVPPSTEWMDYDGVEPRNMENTLSINELTFSACPLCKEKPRLVYSGRWIFAAPFQSESWHFKCCEWIGRVRMENPVDLIRRWNEMCVGAVRH